MKTYSNPKKCLNRLCYINDKGVVITKRDTGSKSKKKFQKLIDSDVFDQEEK